MMALVGAESSYNELAIHDNTPGAGEIHAATMAEAVSIARGLLLAGRSVDLGLGQINSANLGRLGLTAETAFEPCNNLAAAASVLTSAYTDAAETMGEGRTALRVAFSAYNTGNWGSGFRNGYVARVERHAGGGQVVPGLSPDDRAASSVGASSPVSLPAHPAWDVFGDLTPAAASVVVASNAGRSVSAASASDDSGPVKVEALPSIPVQAVPAPSPGRSSSSPDGDGPVSLVRDGARQFRVR